MPDTTVGTPGLCVTKKILSTVLGARRGRLSVSVFSPAGGRLCHPKSSDTVPGLRLERFWGKRHPLEEGAGVLGALEAFSRAGSCSLPQSGSQGRASAGGGVGGGGEEGGSRLADCLPASYSGPLGEQSCLAVGGGPTAGSSWRRPGEGWQQQARSWRRQSQQPSPAAQISSAMNLKAPGSVLCGPAVVLSLRGTTEALLETLGPMVVHLGGPRNSCCN